VIHPQPQPTYWQYQQRQGNPYSIIYSQNPLLNVAYSQNPQLQWQQRHSLQAYSQIPQFQKRDADVMDIDFAKVRPKVRPGSGRKPGSGILGNIEHVSGISSSIASIIGSAQAAHATAAAGGAAAAAAAAAAG